jgi:hypothetical protein
MTLMMEEKDQRRRHHNISSRSIFRTKDQLSEPPHPNASIVDPHRDLSHHLYPHSPHHHHYGHHEVSAATPHEEQELNHYYNQNITSEIENLLQFMDQFTFPSSTTKMVPHEAPLHRPDIHHDDHHMKHHHHHYDDDHHETKRWIEQICRSSDDSSVVPTTNRTTGSRTGEHPLPTPQTKSMDEDRSNTIAIMDSINQNYGHTHNIHTTDVVNVTDGTSNNRKRDDVPNDLHHSVLVSSSSSSSVSGEEREKDTSAGHVPSEHDHHHHFYPPHDEVQTNPSSTPVDPFHSHPDTALHDRTMVREWANSVRRAVAEYVHQYRQYVLVLKNQNQEQEMNTNATIVQYQAQIKELQDELVRTKFKCEQRMAQCHHHCNAEQQRPTIPCFEHPSTSNPIPTTRNRPTILPSAILEQPKPTSTASVPPVSISSSSSGHDDSEELPSRAPPQPQRSKPTPTSNRKGAVRSQPQQDHSRNASSTTLDHEQQRNGAATRTTTTTTTKWMKNENCHVITFRNGTIQEIYYSPHQPIVPPPNQQQQQQRTRSSNRQRLYDIVRFINGDIRMTTMKNDIYYYYAASGIIQIAHSHPIGPPSRSVPPLDIIREDVVPTGPQQVMEYHFPNGQIEYHYHNTDIIMVHFPDGTVQQHTHQKKRNSNK